VPASDTPARLPQAVELVELEPRKHAGLLETWLGRPHVVRWWGDQGQELSALVRRRPDTHAVILADGIPVGYVCWEPLSAEERAAARLTDLPDALVDIDILIGEPQLVGRGIGPRALRLLVGRLHRHAEARWAGLGTSRSNHAAVSAAKKAGFIPFGDFDDPVHGPCRYFVIDLLETARPGGDARL
jgi:aminoglycoside 6'-N-acetyltransferase